MKITLKKNVYRKNKKTKNAKKNKMKGGSLTKEEFKSIIKRLNDNDETLITLDISNNNIGNIGASALASALKVNKILVTLNISNNNIGNIGATALAGALKVNKKLITLDISNNNIGDIGASDLGDAVKFNISILIFNISNNNIGDIGATNLVDALKFNTEILKIDISNNLISMEFIKQLALSKLQNNLDEQRILNIKMGERNKLQIIMVPQKKSKAKLLYKKAFDKIKEHKMKFICSDAGVCLAFGKYSDIIKEYFDNFTSFKYVDIDTPIKLISSDSTNGLIYEIKYKHDEYISYAILKSTKDIKNYPDNLMYEYNVGLFVNCLNKIYPCFIETYGLYTLKDTYKRIYHDLDLSLSDSDFNLNTDLEQINSIDYNIGCENYQYLSILIQHLKDVKSLPEIYNDDFINNELIQTLFQIYIPLYIVRDYFTHYDLHNGNVLIYEPKENHYIEFHYHFKKYDEILKLGGDDVIISFKSRYMSKIIDYGRSYFNYSKTFFSKFKEADDSNSLKVNEQICNADKCNCINTKNTKCCGRDHGLNFLNLEKNTTNYVTSRKKNISHDLLLINNFKKHKIWERNSKFDWVKSLVYDKDTGTSELPMSNIYNWILNIKDLAKILISMLNNIEFKEENDKLYLTKTKLGDLHIYVNELKPMEYIPVDKLENMFP